MRLTGLSVERLRWGLLAGALLLVGVLVVLLSYGRYRAVEAWKQIVKRSGATITHETDGITWSQAVRGKTIFVLHAARAIPHGEGRYTAENGTLVLYDAKEQPAYRISGANFEYDEKTGVAKALGEVNMDLELPKGLTAKGSGAAEEGAAQVVHVRTSGLTYVKKLGVAATDQEVEIAYGNMHGWAKGAEFDSEHSVVHLLADVRAEGQLHGAHTPAGELAGATGAAVTLTAAKADLDRDADVIDLTAPRVESRGRVATAATAVLHLRKDGSLETLEARGAVTLKQGTRTITAPGLNAAMNGESQMEHAELAGGVVLVDTSAVRPMKGSAKTVKIACDGAGNPTSVVAEGGAALSESQPGRSEPSLGRQMGADRMTLTLVKAAHGGAAHGGAGGGMRVSAVHAEGNAWATGDAVVRSANGKTARGNAAGVKTGGVKTAEIKTMRVAGDDLRLALVRDAEGKDEPQSLSGAGHTRIEQRMPDGTVETSGGEALRVTFEPAKSGAGVEIASAVQTGHVEIRGVPGKAGGQPSEGVAESAALDGASDVVTLTSPQRASSSGTPTGRPRLTRGDTSLSAETIRLMQTTGDAVAEGNVAATFVKAKAGAAAGSSGAKKLGSSEAPVTHALAQRATLRRAQETVEFTGTDATPARMWQGASQVEAANLLLDRTHDSMEAWPAAASGVVRAVFAEKQGSGIREQGSGSREQGSGSREQGSGIREQGTGIREQGSGIRDQGLGIREQGPGRNGLGLKGDRVVRVTSGRLDYSGISDEAVFTGGVLAQGEDGQVRAQRAVAFLGQGSGSRAQSSEGQGARGPEGQGSEGRGSEGQGARGPEGQGARGAEGQGASRRRGVAEGEPDPVAGSVEKIVMSGGVKVQQPGRVGTGDQLLYTAATGEFVLTGTPGHPPRVADDKQGNITGATLLFRSADSTIVVAGEPASRRVHTETTIRK
jgi:lipopolysaccharide export system protein LptA